MMRLIEMARRMLGERRLSPQEENSRLLREEFMKGVTKVKSYPEEITLATTTKCNKNPPCVICDRNLKSREKEKDLDDDILERVVSLIRRADKVYLHAGGEPLLYPKFDKILESARAPTKIIFNTNGILLTREKAESIVKSGVVNVISFSLDAASADTYKKIRGGGFDTVISNIKGLQECKREMGREYPHIIINMCVFKENFHEMAGMIELAEELKADKVDFFHLNKGWNWEVENQGFRFNYSEQELMDAEAHDQHLIDAYNKAKEVGIRINFAGSAFLGEETEEKKLVREQITEINNVPDKSCIAPWSKVFITSEGEVRVCCYHGDDDEHIGNLKEKPFKNIWNDEKISDMRRQFKDKGSCSFCIKKNSCAYLGRV